MLPPTPTYWSLMRKVNSLCWNGLAKSNHIRLVSMIVNSWLGNKWSI